MIPPSNDLQTDRRILVPLGTIHLMAEFVLRVLWRVAFVLCVLGGIDRGHGEDNARVVEEVPLRRVAPVPGLVVRCGGTK